MICYVSSAESYVTSTWWTMEQSPCTPYLFFLKPFGHVSLNDKAKVCQSIWLLFRFRVLFLNKAIDYSLHVQKEKWFCRLFQPQQNAKTLLLTIALPSTFLALSLYWFFVFVHFNGLMNLGLLLGVHPWWCWCRHCWVLA